MSNEVAELFAWLMDTYWDDPGGFAVDVLDFYPDEWQEKVLIDLATSNWVTVRSDQGVGKTVLESVAALWSLSCRPYPKVIATAPTRQQLNDVLWAEIAKWTNQSELLGLILQCTKTRVYMIGHEERWFAVAKTATKPENLASFHEDYILFIVDEASGVADPIKETILGTFRIRK